MAALRTSLVSLCLLFVASGCGGDDGSSSDDSNSGGSPAATGGGAATGGSSASGGVQGNTGGSSSGGGSTGGSATGGDASASGGSDGGDDQHCDPGEFIPFPYNTSQAISTVVDCPDWDNGGLFGLTPDDGAQTLRLPAPAKAGEPYAISFAYLSAGVGTLEYYGTDEVCGPPLEKLSSEEMSNRKLICTDFTPQADYPYVLMVIKDTSYSQGGVTFCSNVTCN